MGGLSENGDENAARFSGECGTVVLRAERHVSDDPFGVVVNGADLFPIEQDPRRGVDTVSCLGELNAQGIDGVGHVGSQERIEGLNTCAVVLAPFQAYSSDREVKAPRGINGYRRTSMGSDGEPNLPFGSQPASHTTRKRGQSAKEDGNCPDAH